MTYKNGTKLLIGALVAAFILVMPIRGDSAENRQAKEPNRKVASVAPISMSNHANGRGPGPATGTVGGGKTGASIIVSRVKAKWLELINPLNPFWSKLPQAAFPLYPQNIVIPHGGGSIKEIKVRAVRAEDGIAFQLEWLDPIKDDDTVHQVKFRDGVAIEFPIDRGKDTVLAMGHPNGPVNIWHWKADWEPDAPRMNAQPYNSETEKRTGQDIYKRLQVDSAVEANAAQGASGPTSGVFNLFPQSAHKSPVEDIVAIGISSITTKPERCQNLKGRGIWRAGKWTVVIYKPLSNGDISCPSFASGGTVNAAFAVWDGAHQERNGMKSISNWTVIKCQ